MAEPDSGTIGQHHPARRRFFALWGGLPDFFALVPFVWCLSSAITTMVVASHIGRQSSTAGIGPFLTILAAPVLAAAGIMLGRLASFFVAPLVHDKLVRWLRWCALLALVVIAAVASRQASAPIYAAELEARPRVLVNAAQIIRRHADVPVGSTTPAVRAYDRLAKVNQAIPWGDGSAQLAYQDAVLDVSFSPAGRSLRIPLPGITYVISVDAIPLRMGLRAQPVLALLITGRATGRRDLIALVSEGGELVYLELLDRFWNFRSVPLAIMPSPAGDVVLVGSEPRNLLVFAQQAAP